MTAAQKKLTVLPPPPEPFDGFRSAVEALQNVDEPTRIRILGEIVQRDPKMAEKLRKGLFDFSDLQYLLPLDFKVLWWECPRVHWPLALRKAVPAIFELIQKQLSKRAFAELEEQIQSLGPQPLSKVLEAQQEICNWVRKLVGEGRMAMPAKGENKMV